MYSALPPTCMESLMHCATDKYKSTALLSSELHASSFGFKGGRLLAFSQISVFLNDMRNALAFCMSSEHQHSPEHFSRPAALPVCKALAKEAFVVLFRAIPQSRRPHRCRSRLSPSFLTTRPPSPGVPLSFRTSPIQTSTTTFHKQADKKAHTAEVRNIFHLNKH